MSESAANRFRMRSTTENAPPTLERRGAGHGGISSMPTTTLSERFWGKVDRKGPDDCWEWQAWKGARGYGRFWKDGAGRPAHRVAYELEVGPIPEGLQIDHLCRNPSCVNPTHLEPVTPTENVRRAVPYWSSRKGMSFPDRRQTHCINGHPLEGENLRINTRGHRICVTCTRATYRRHYARHLAKGANNG